jgi:hypothetical protein
VGEEGQKCESKGKNTHESIAIARTCSNSGDRCLARDSSLPLQRVNMARLRKSEEKNCWGWSQAQQKQRLTTYEPLLRRGKHFRDDRHTCHEPEVTSHVPASHVKSLTARITCMRTLRKSSNSLNRLRTTWLPLRHTPSNTQTQAAAAAEDLSLLTCIRCAQNVSFGS